MSITDHYADLVAAGALRAVATFSGGGDEGGVNDVTVVMANGTTVEVMPYFDSGPWAGLVTAIDERISEDYDFNNYPYVSGTLTIDVGARKVSLSATETWERDEEAGWEEEL